LRIATLSVAGSTTATPVIAGAGQYQVGQFDCGAVASLNSQRRSRKVSQAGGKHRESDKISKKQALNCETNIESGRKSCFSDSDGSSGGPSRSTIKVTLGITADSRSFTSTVRFAPRWFAHRNLGRSSSQGFGPVRRLKAVRELVQNVVRQFGPISVHALKH